MYVLNCLLPELPLSSASYSFLLAPARGRVFLPYSPLPVGVSRESLSCSTAVSDREKVTESSSDSLIWIALQGRSFFFRLFCLSLAVLYNLGRLLGGGTSELYSNPASTLSYSPSPSSEAVENSSSEASLSSLLASQELIRPFFFLGLSDFLCLGGDFCFSPTRFSTLSISFLISSQSDSVLVWPTANGDIEVPLLYPMSRVSDFWCDLLSISRSESLHSEDILISTSLTTALSLPLLSLDRKES